MRTWLSDRNCAIHIHTYLQVLPVIPDSSPHMSRVYRAFRICEVQVPWEHAGQCTDVSVHTGLVLLDVIS